MLEKANIFMTGGAGTLGRAIARRRREAGWSGKLTVFSRDTGKHNAMARAYPDVNYIQGDIRNAEMLRLAMIGHDVVIHAAAVKFIPEAEYSSIDTIDINVYGTELVCEAAREAGISHVLGISTDKACHPANCYGSTKHLMEKIFQEHARYGGDTQFHLVRYGNVLESRGSVIEIWHDAVKRGEAVKITDKSMTRFWLSPSQAALYVEHAFHFPGGCIYIPKMPALSIGKLFDYVIGWDSDVDVNEIPMRPGEKLHETLLTEEETEFAEHVPADGEAGYFLLHPTTDSRLEVEDQPMPYTSEFARELTREELTQLLKD